MKSNTRSQKPQDSERSLGEKFRLFREARRLSIADVSRHTHIAARYIRAFEENRYADLPARVYARGFLKKLFLLFPVDEEEQKKILDAFDVEWEIHRARVRKHPPVSSNAPQPFFAPLYLSIGIPLVLIAVMVTFIALKLGTIIMPPRLEISEPPENLVIKKPIVRARGTTAKESRLTVNGREIAMDAKGAFDDIIELQPGVNELEFLVEDRFGKKTEEMRYVVVE